MSNSLDFSGGGSRPPKVIINAYSTNGFTPLSGAGSAYGVKPVLSGALTANVLKTVLSVSGQGILNFLSFYSVNVTSRTLRCKLTVDSVVVFDSTSTATTIANAGGVVVGTFFTAPSAAILDQVNFNSSILVEIASGLTETDFMGISYSYKTY